MILAGIGPATPLDAAGNPRRLAKNLPAADFAVDLVLRPRRR
jgi:hypothetical protein